MYSNWEPTQGLVTSILPKNFSTTILRYKSSLLSHRMTGPEEKVASKAKSMHSSRYVNVTFDKASDLV